MQARNESGTIDLRAAAGSVAEADDVGAVPPEPGLESQSLGVIDKRGETGITVAVIAYQDRQLRYSGHIPAVMSDTHIVCAFYPSVT